MKDSTLKKLWWISYIFAICNIATLGFGFMEVYRILGIFHSEYSLIYTLFIPEFIAIITMTFCEKKLKLKERGIVL
ncbi:MAG TPA: hypothetical protein VFD51_02730 [Patescibacteria group bacterium]|nr:hypothetical protein [Patescibacteria group bacterium]